MHTSPLIRIAAALVTALLLSCASKMAPGGGPADSTPPALRSCVPENGAVHHPLKAPLRLSFSEWIDPARVQKDLIVSPEPEGGIRVEVQGHSLTVSAKKGFADSTTYHLSLPKGFTDLQNVNANTPFDLYFSTGAALDSCRVFGRIIPDAPLANPASAALWRLRPGFAADSLLSLRPDCVAPCDSSGRFVAAHLRPGIYLLAAFADANSDRKFNPGSEAVFAAQELTVNVKDSLGPILLFPLDGDTATAKVATVSASAGRILSGTWKSRPLDDRLPVCSVQSVDSPFVAHELMLLRPADPQSFVLVSRDSLPNGQYYLITTSAARLTMRAETRDTLRFNMSSLADTIAPRLASVAPTRASGPHPRIRLRFSEAVLFTASSVAAVTGSDTVLCTPKASAADRIELTPGRALTPGSTYTLQLTPAMLSDLAGNKPKGDSLTGLLKAEVRIMADDSLAASFSGAPDVPRPDVRRIWQLATFAGDTLACPEKNGGFRFDSLPGCTGRMSAFLDHNANGLIDRGRLFPFRAPEEAVFFSDTVEARARWDVDGVIIKASSQFPELFPVK